MAEGGILHLAAATWDELSPWLDQRAFRIPDGRTWSYPFDYAILLYEYPDFEIEYDPVEIEQIRQKLGQMPTLSLCLELRRSLGDEACDMATWFTRELLRSFPGVADDGASEEPYWTLGDIEGKPDPRRGRFLDCYRSGR